jgi:hypothetical protein
MHRKARGYAHSIRSVECSLKGLGLGI